MSYTTIRVESGTLDKLKVLKLTKRESYEEIINRLIIKEKTAIFDKKIA